MEQYDQIYLIGGYEHRNDIQVLNLQNADSLQEAQSRQWSFMTSLKNGVAYPAVIHSNDQLLVVGRTGDSSTSQDVHYLSLASNTTGVYAGTIDCGDYSSGLRYSGFYNVIGGNFSIFGGYKASPNCIQQTTQDLESKWNCVSSSESALENLGYQDDGSSYYIRYANFVV